MIPYCPQKIVNFDPTKIDPLSVMDFYGTPNLENIFSFKKKIIFLSQHFLKKKHLATW
jgi:hypothetical protein